MRQYNIVKDQEVERESVERCYSILRRVHEGLFPTVERCIEYDR